MKAIIQYKKGPESIRLDDVPVPEPRRGEVRIKVEAAGLCGTDRHINMTDSYPTNPPVVLGHEVCGVVDKLGDEVEGYSAGERVTSETYYYTCGKCNYCRIGRYNLCNERRSIGSGANGAFAQYVVVPLKNLHRVPDNVSSEEGALIEPLACCTQAVFEKTKVNAAETALITGPGCIGLLALQVVKACGARCIMVGTPKDAERLAVAEELGADLVLDTSKENLEDFILEYCNSIGADLVLECSGAEAAISMALNVIKKGGLYTQMGLSGHPVSIDVNQITMKEIEYRGTFATKWQAYEDAIRLIAGGKIRLKPLISEVVPLHRWEDVFKKSIKGIGIKYIFRPDLDS